MALTIQIPEGTGALLRNAFGGDLSRAIIEALAADGYRTGKLSVYEVQVLLGLDDRWETESWLGGRGVFRNYDAEDLDADRQSLRRVLGPPGR